MTERPILFSGAMVRAILDGRKTQTRRIVAGIDPSYRLRSSTIIEMTKGRSGVWFMDAPLEESTDHVLALNRYGIPGDRLWVKETHAAYAGAVVYRADLKPGSEIVPPWFACWKPSIFMRREYSRITLEVTDIRVERLQAISEADASAEGIDEREGPLPAVETYAALWDSINAARAPWAANPWVWVVSFRRVEVDRG